MINVKSLGAALGSALLGWLVASLVLFLIFFAMQSLSTHRDAYQVTAIAVVIIWQSLPTCLIAAATLGLGWHVFASKRQLRSRKHYCLAGALIGAAVGVAMSTDFLLSAWWVWVVIGTIYAAVCGALTGLYAWLMLRPDRGAPNPPTSAS